MGRFSRALQLGVLLTALSVKGWAAEDGSWLLLAHLDGRAGLAQAAAVYSKQLLALARPGVVVVVQTVHEAAAGGESVVTRQWGKAGISAPSAVPIGSLAQAEDGSVLVSSLVRFGRSRFHTAKTALVVLGHGGGLPEAPGETGRLTPRELSRAVGRALRAADGPLDLIGLDVCYAGTLEVAYEFRQVARYLTAAPGLIYSPGLDWLGAFAAADLPQMSGRDLASELVKRGMSGIREVPVALVAVDLSQTQATTSTLSTLCALLRRNLKTEWEPLAVVRGQARGWGAHDELCDLGELAEGLNRCAISPDVRESAKALRESLQHLVICTWRSPSPRAASPSSGIGIYFPGHWQTMPALYGRWFALAGETDWGRLLDEYWTWQRRLLIGGGD